jgi:hypothetical protein
MTAGNMLASLEGRKWITRRCFRGEQPPADWSPEVGYYCPTKIDRHGEEYPGDEIFGASDADWGRKCPHGAPRDSLALTETWRPVDVIRGHALIVYKADMASREIKIPDDDAREKIKRALKHGKWMPPMFMQAWASRAPAVNKSVRVERVQEITEEDAKAEGAEPDYGSNAKLATDVGMSMMVRPTARQGFEKLWDSINASRGHGWDVNDWVWVIEYELDADALRATG